jgi:flagellar motor switch protein FliG
MADKKDDRREKPDPAGGRRADRKTGMDPSLKGFIKETTRDAGYRKAARLLMILGKDEAAKVLSHLSPKEVEGIAQEIARTEHIDQKEAAAILEEFGYIRQTKDLIASGGIEKAEEMLVASIGRERAEAILTKVKKEMAPPPFSFLMDIDIHQTVSLLREESPPVIALIMAHLEPKVAARILSSLPPEVQKEVVPRIAKMGTIDAEVIRRAEETLRTKIRDQGKVVTDEVNGKAALTEILKYMDPAKEQAILEELEPNTANEIRKSLFTAEVIFQITDKDLQGALRDYADREIALMLKGQGDAFRERILANVSERRREFILLEIEGLGLIPKSKADSALDDFLGYLQLLEQKGEITIMREPEKYV